MLTYLFIFIIGVFVSASISYAIVNSRVLNDYVYYVYPPGVDYPSEPEKIFRERNDAENYISSKAEPEKYTIIEIENEYFM